MRIGLCELVSERVDEGTTAGTSEGFAEIWLWPVGGMFDLRLCDAATGGFDEAEF